MLGPQPVGYGERMSEPPNETSSESADQPEPGVITDEQLPDDLRPDKNPMARDPDDDENTESSAPGGPEGPAAGGDMSQPG